MNHISQRRRSQLFFGQYRYGLKFYLRFSSATRDLDPDLVRDRIHRRFIGGYYFDNMVNKRTELGAVIQPCLELCAALKSISSPYQRMVSYDTQYIYSNDLKILQKLAKESYLSRCELYEADVCLPAGVVQLKQSNHTMRSYFKDRCYNKEQMALLKNFLFNRLDTIRITPLFYHRLDSGRVHWLGRYFIDHSSEHDVLMLNLVLPNCIRKTMPIVCE